MPEMPRMNSTPIFRSVSCMQRAVTPADVDLGAERNHGDRDQREHHGDERRQEIENFVDVRRNHVFLGDQLDDVGQRLQQAVRSHAARADASWMCAMTLRSIHCR